MLDHYVRTVGLYLPERSTRADILAELADHLQSKIEERESSLGRRLTEPEQQEVVAAHGNPVDVAARYGRTQVGLAFGRQIISPEGFPAYLIGIGLTFGVTIAINLFMGLYAGTPLRVLAGRIAAVLFFEFTTITIVFAGIDVLWRRELQTASRPRRYLSFPPPYMQPIPRVQSVSGLILLSVTAMWWAAVPFYPSLLLAGAARTLEFTTAWQSFYWPILLLLITGIAQRVLTLAKPEWSGLQFATRLCLNGAMLAMVYPILRAYPYVSALDAATDPVAASLLAQKVNGLIWAQLLVTGGLYWLFWAGFHAWLCVMHFRDAFQVHDLRGPC
jgi:hypothetical protein